jgi:hypothetical protein
MKQFIGMSVRFWMNGMPWDEFSIACLYSLDSRLTISALNDSRSSLDSHDLLKFIKLIIKGSIFNFIEFEVKNVRFNIQK